MPQKHVTGNELTHTELGDLEGKLGLRQAVRAGDSAVAVSDGPRERPRFTIVLPAYNEGERITPTLEALKREFGGEAEIIVVDDGSSDNTSSVAESLGVRVIKHVVNQGKGAAVKTGFRNSSGRVVGFVDADNSATARDVRRVFERAEEKGAATGSRLNRTPEMTVKRGFVRGYASWLFRQAVKYIGQVDVEDTQCGCKAFESGLAGRIQEKLDVDGWIFDVKMLRIVRDEGYRVEEVGISWEDKPGSKVKLIRDGLKMVWGLVKMRFGE